MFRAFLLLSALLASSPTIRAASITVPFSFDDTQVNLTSKLVYPNWILTDPAIDIPKIPAAGHFDSVSIKMQLNYQIGYDTGEGMQFFYPFITSDAYFQFYKLGAEPIMFASGSLAIPFQGITLPPNTHWTSPTAKASYQITSADVDLSLFQAYPQWSPIIATTSQGMTRFTGSITGEVTYVYTVPEPAGLALAAPLTILALFAAIKTARKSPRALRGR